MTGKGSCDKMETVGKPKITIETERLQINPVTEADKTYYMALRASTSDYSIAYKKLPGFSDYEFEQELNSEDDIYFCVCLKPDHIFIGSTSIQGFNNDTIFIGFDIVEEYRNNGLATEILLALLEKCHELFPKADVRVKMKKDNLASKRVAEKCGGDLVGYDDSDMTKYFDSRGNCNLDQEMIDTLEKGRDSVLVYKLP